MRRSRSCSGCREPASTAISTSPCGGPSCARRPWPRGWRTPPPAHSAAPTSCCCGSARVCRPGRATSSACRWRSFRSAASATFGGCRRGRRWMDSRPRRSGWNSAVPWKASCWRCATCRWPTWKDAICASLWPPASSPTRCGVAPRTNWRSRTRLWRFCSIAPIPTWRRASRTASGCCCWPCRSWASRSGCTAPVCCCWCSV